jgi:hypothetical protein
MQFTSQRRLGLTLGLFLGLGFAITSNYINQWTIPDIPLYTPWPGRIGVVILTTAVFGLLGLLAAWTDEAIPGILLSGLAGSVLSSIWIFITASSNLGGVFALLLLVFLPRMFFYIPFGWLVRWLMDRVTPHIYRASAPAKRWASVLVAFAAVSLLGVFSRHNEETRISLQRMQDLLDEGLQANAFDELPGPLQDVQGFLANANGEYAFDIGSNPDALPVQRPIVEYGAEEPFIIVRFDNGFRFGCVFSPPYVVPACIDY